LIFASDNKLEISIHVDLHVIKIFATPLSNTLVVD